MMRPRTLCGLALAAVLLGGNAAQAASVSYVLTGMTNLDRIMPGVLEDVPINGTATLDFQGSRVTLTEFSISFADLGRTEIMGLLFLDGSLSVTGGSGLLGGNVLAFDGPSSAALTITCNGRQDFCDLLGPGTIVGVPKPGGTRGPFLLADFVFDAAGNFTTVQDFEKLLPIGLAGVGASDPPTLAVSLRATQVPEPSALSLLGLALLGIASARARASRA
jgi:hypothetical protein